MQGGGQFVAGDPHEEGADDGRQHPHRRHRQREHDDLDREAAAGEDDGRVGDGRHYRPHIGLEEVGAHTRHITHVVAHVVGDDRRVAGVVLGYPRLDLAHQVGAYVRRLGVDAAPHPGEQGDRRSAQSDGGDDVVAVGVGDVEQLHEHQVTERHPQQTQAGHAETHHRPAPEGHRKGLLHPALAGRLGGAAVGGGGDPHSREAGPRRQHRPEDIGDGTPGGAPWKDDRDEHRHEHHEHRHPGVFTPHEGVGARADGRRQLLHAVVSLIGGQHHPGVVDRQDDGRGAGRQSGDRYGVGHDRNLFLDGDS